MKHFKIWVFVCFTLIIFLFSGCATNKDKLDTHAPKLELNSTIKELMQNYSLYGENMNSDLSPVCVHNIKTIVKKYTSCTENGLVVEICTICDEVVAEHISEVTNHIEVLGKTKNASCSEEGYIEYKCAKCKRTIRSEKIPKISHEYHVMSVIGATPIADGYNTLQCINCQYVTKEFFKWENEFPNAIYIPELNLYTELTIGVCNQEYADNFDIVCDYNFINTMNPVLFGHNTKSIGDIYKLDIGDYIYIIRDGNIDSYKIKISEMGVLIDGGRNIEGVETGTKCISNCKTSTLHVFTCFDSAQYKKARWIIIAEKVQ